MRTATLFRNILLCLSLLLTTACSPKFDWRDVRGNGYTATFPAKPSSLTRQVNLGGRSVAMTMTAAEIDGVTFAVGSAEMADASQAASAVPVMKEALVGNIHGRLKSEKADASSGALDVEALGSAPAGDAKLLLLGRFASKGKRVYQAVVVGPEKNLSREAADTFLSSFKAD
jgi:hypothetical protein